MNYNLEVSAESADKLFVDMLKEQLENLLDTRGKQTYFPETDYVDGLVFADAFDNLMRYNLTGTEYDTWKQEEYYPRMSKWFVAREEAKKNGCE